MNSDSLEEKGREKEHAVLLLEKLKNKEKKIRFHSIVIGTNTIVSCNKEERLNEYITNYKKKNI
jgi:hypothetical protein